MKQETVTILQNNLDYLISRHNALIKSGNYGDALNIMKNIEAITRQCKELNISTEVERNYRWDTWYNILEFFIRTKQSQLIKLDYSTQESQKKHRGTGKTDSIIRLSSVYNVPILSNGFTTLTQSLKDKSMNTTYSVDIIENEKDLYSKKYKDVEIILVDEGSFIDNIDTSKYIVIGFTK